MPEGARGKGWGRGWRRALVVLGPLSVVGLVLVGLHARRRPQPGVPERRVPLEVLFSGCARVRVGPFCELGERRELRLWIPGDPKRLLELTAAEKVVAADALRPIRGGAQL